MFDFIDNYLDEKEKLKLIMETDENGDNILHCAACFSDSVDILEKVCIYIKLICNREDKNFRDFVKRKGQSKRNILMSSICACNFVAFSYIIHNFLVDLNDIELNEFLRETDSRKENLFHYIGRYGTLEMLEAVIKMNIPHNTLKDLLKSSVSVFVKKTYPLYCAVESNSLEVFKAFDNIYDRFFNLDERKEIYNQMDLERLAERNDKEENMINAVKESLEQLKNFKF
jgi:hypothetical protein